MTPYPRQLFRFFCTLGCLLLFGCAVPNHHSRQEQVHHMGHHVMPFDLSKTLHIFRMTESGGVQQVVVRDGADTEQIALIRKHLQVEASAFQRGDFADPAKVHGAEMPGLKELQQGAGQIKVSYADLPNGAEIIYATSDLRMLTAIHRWFGAQLSEHGRDAMAE